eukprot:gene3100-3567_t
MATVSRCSPRKNQCGHTRHAPNEDIVNLLSGTSINYFHCLKIIDLLKKCGEGTTNFFGQYSSQRMKDWVDLVQFYKEENIHLAEAADHLIRNVNYEIPSLRKQIGKCQQTQRDCHRREAEYISNAAIFKEKYQQVCKEMGVRGDNVKQELLNLVNVLPEEFEKITSEARCIEEAINYYSAFIDFVVPKDDQKTMKSEHDVTPTLSFICRHGNGTCYQLRTGKPPPVNALKTKQEESTKGDVKKDESNDGGIDFGDENEINFGDDIDFGIEAVTNENEATIDFGIETVTNEDEAGIDYGIETVNSEADIDFGIETVDIEVEDIGVQANPNEDCCVGDEALNETDLLSVFEHSATRNIIINELIELQSFLSQRLEEMSEEGDILSANQFQSASMVIQKQTKDKLRGMYTTVSDVIERLTSMKMQNLYRLKSSPRYVDRLAESLQQKMKTANNLLKQAKVMVERRDAAFELQRETEPRLQIIIEKTKELKQQISEEISKKYKNRKVNIMGEINSL